MKRFYCTYFDKNYLARGMAFIESLQKHEIKDYELYVICMDELTMTLLKILNYTNVKLIPFDQIERSDKRLLNTKNNRSPVEYIWTAKSSIIFWLLNTFSNIEALCYFDADMYFFQSPDPIWKELLSYSVVIHEHRFSKDRMTLSRFGNFNAGFFGFCNDLKGKNVLNWWRDRTLECCSSRLENDKFADQLYLHYFPNFDCVQIIKHIGVGVAPWNHIQYYFSKNNNNQLLVNDSQLIFYHFHSLLPVEPEFVIPSTNLKTVFSIDIMSLCYIPYVENLQKSFTKIRNIQHDFSYGLQGKIIITKEHTFLAHKSIRQAIKNLSSNIPHKHIPLADNWDCYATFQLQG